MSASSQPNAKEPVPAGAELNLPSRAQLASFEQLLIRWMRFGLLTPGIAGVVLCASAVLLFIADDQFREYQAVLITMLGVGGVLILGAAAVAAWRPDGFATYLTTHSDLLDAAARESREGF